MARNIPLLPELSHLLAAIAVLVGSHDSVGAAENVSRKLTVADQMAMQAMLNAQIKPCLPPSFVGEKATATLRMSMNPDGTLAQKPVVVTADDPTVAGAAIRAVARCITSEHPLGFKRELYPSWKVFDFRVQPGSP
jgi:colicin import membrane protein